MILLIGKKQLLNKKGFLLLETFVALAVLIIGLVFVSRSLMSSLDAFRISSEYSQAILISEQVLWDIIQNKEDSLGNSSGGLAAFDKTFEWSLAITPLDKDIPNLNQAHFELSWRGKRKKETLQIITYLPSP